MMLYLIYLFFLSIFIIFLNKYLINRESLISETGDKHQKFASKTNIPLTGGIFIFLSFLFLFKQIEFYFLLFSSTIFLLGIFSDLKLIKSAKIRLFFQIILIIGFVVLSNTQIYETRVYLIDKLLSNTIFSYFFVIFCILIVVNGSNFFDGLNTLNVGYYLLVSLVVFYLNFSQQIFFNEILIINLGLSLLVTFILNSLNKIYLGDSGSYLLGFIFGILLINLYSLNSNISPFFIILLLWYPSFELLFSVIRKKILNKSPLEPDSDHLHQLIFYSLKKKNSLKIYSANLLAAYLINSYNLIIFIISMNNLNNTQLQVILILLNLIIYTVIYFKLIVYRYKRI